MNLAMIFVITTLAVSALAGYRKGFLRIIYSLVSWIIVMAFVSRATPYIQAYLMERTPVYEILQKQCGDALGFTDMQTGMGSAGSDIPVSAEKDAFRAELAGLGIRLPEAVEDRIFENIVNAADSFLAGSGIYEEITGGLAYFAVEGIAFLTALVSAWLFVHVISRLLGIASHIPVVKGVNRIIGLFAGGLYGMLIVWIAFYLVTLCSASELGRLVISDIYKNSFLTYIYENNIIFLLILKYFPK